MTHAQVLKRLRVKAKEAVKSSTERPKNKVADKAINAPADNIAGLTFNRIGRKVNSIFKKKKMKKVLFILSGVLFFSMQAISLAPYIKLKQKAEESTVLKQELGKVVDWYVIDTKGNKIPVTYSAKGNSTCQVCSFLPNGMAACYEISCADLPKPKTNAVKTAH